MRTLDFNKIHTLQNYIEEVPFEVIRRSLYDAEELYEGFDPDDDKTQDTCCDALIYKHYLEKGKQPEDIWESLCRSIHDHDMHINLKNFFKDHDSRKCIGIMGGHANSRKDEMFREVVLLSKKLTEKGFVMLSGGGPGAMEATHLGAWMAGRRVKDVDDALQILSVAPTFRDKGWLSSAMKVKAKYPQKKYHSLAIPTWLYGHEPSTPFATHIAKFFENSIREDSILTYAFGGIVYTPGSAGTMQEIFQDAVQNHYLSYGFASPMIFMGKDFWTKEMPAYPLLEELVARGKYKNMIMALTDSIKEVVDKLTEFQQNFKQ
ncbi:MAG: hypothetical protein J6X91_08645 [Bacteroidales bacterium]|nr:hypothetical protein [Bacteroidales bacterium]MBP5518707.1 hypothetical protein [Bacteroidales bacterium]